MKFIDPKCQTMRAELGCRGLVSFHIRIFVKLNFSFAGGSPV